MWVVPEYNRQALMPKKKEQYQRRREFRRTVCLAYVHTLPPPPIERILRDFWNQKTSREPCLFCPPACGLSNGKLSKRID